MKTTIFIWYVLVGLSWLSACSGGDDFPIFQSVEVTPGTLESATLPNIGWVFVAANRKEAFSVGSSLTPTGLLNAREVGFVMNNGAEYQYGAEGVRDTLKRATTENPNSKAEFYLFKNDFGRLFRLKIFGRTEVYRLDLEVGGEKIALWINR